MPTQLALLGEIEEPASSPQRDTSTTFQDNLSLPIHRWFRYSAGFSATWVGAVVRDLKLGARHTVLDPFAGAGTTLVECQLQGVRAIGLDPHPFVSRVARAKLMWSSDANAFRRLTTAIISEAQATTPDTADYPALIHACYSADHLSALDRLRRVVEILPATEPASRLAWLTLSGILRATSRAGTAQWQYVLPKKSKKRVPEPFEAYRLLASVIADDMEFAQANWHPVPAEFHEADARSCEPVEDHSIDCVITSPPYPNNYDYADATRLEMCFFREIAGWSDLQDRVRSRLVRSCSQHVPPRSIDLDEVLSDPAVAAIRPALSEVCERLTALRLTKGGKKTYNNMLACYYLDMAHTWKSLRRVCRPGAHVCFVIGDSAPYGVHAPAVDWMGALALAAGFRDWRFEKTRDRNVKWKNRKHRVPLVEGRLWVQG